MAYKVKKNSRGSALISALLITAIVAAIATVMAISQRILIRETQLVLNSDRAYLDLQGVNDWAVVTLTNDKALQNAQLPDSFPKIMPPTNNYQGAKIRGKIIDAQGLFNINSLQSPNNEAYFVYLLEALDNQ